jgi:uncharacterized protein (DUF2336 family)
LSDSGGTFRRINPAALQTLAREATTASRSELAKSVVGLFGNPIYELSDDARTMAYEILHTIVRDIEMATRQEIGRRLAERPDVPRDLIRFLANDAIEVAFPVLVNSGLLDDADLIAVINSHTLEHALAIAARPTLRPPVTDALVATDAEDVIVEVLKNPGAEFSPRTFADLVEKSRQKRPLREPILMRREMTPELALRMFLWVTAALREHILNRFSFDRNAVNQLCDQIASEEIENFVAVNKAGKGDFSKKLPALVKEKGRLTPEMLVLALREGDVSTFNGILIRLAEIPNHFVDRLLFDSTGRGLAVACKSLGMGKIAFSSIFALAQKIRGEVDGLVKQRLRAASEFFDQLSKQDAVDVVGQWRKGADYVASMQVLGERMRVAPH